MNVTDHRARLKTELPLHDDSRTIDQRHTIEFIFEHRM